MDVSLFHHTWLGAAITLQVALSFVYLSALAIAHRMLASSPPRAAPRRSSAKA